MRHYIHNVLVLVTVVWAVVGEMRGALFVRRDHAARSLGGGEEKEEVGVCAMGCVGNPQCQGFLLDNGACVEVDHPIASVYGPKPCFLLEGLEVVSSTLYVTNGVPAGEFSPAAFCEPGTYAAGFRMRAFVHLYVGGHDDTAVSAIMLSCVRAASLGEVANVTSFPGLTGEWQEQVDCPTDYWITSFALKVEEWANHDNTGVNNMDVGCRGPGLTGTDLVHATWSIPYELHIGWGEYGNFSASCAPGTAVCGLSAKHTAEGAPDDVGVADLILICC